jgi:hypothetical protein
LRILAKPLSRKTLIIGLVMVSVLVTSAYALTALFTHTFPATPTGTTQVVTTTCSASSLSIANKDTFFTGANFDILYTCPMDTVALTATTGTVTPVYTLPSIAGTTLLLTLDAHTTFNVCSGTLFVLSSGSPVTFGSQMGNFPPGDYDYCLTVVNYPGAGIPTFIATWSQ